MSLKDTPVGGAGRIAPVALLTRAVERLRRHLRTWPRRYVDMRVEARGGDD